MCVLGWANYLEQTLHCCEPRTGFWVGRLLCVDSRCSEGLSETGSQESRLEGPSSGMSTNLLAANINLEVWRPDPSFSCEDYLYSSGIFFLNKSYIKLGTIDGLNGCVQRTWWREAFDLKVCSLLLVNQLVLVGVLSILRYIHPRCMYVFGRPLSFQLREASLRRQ